MGIKAQIWKITRLSKTVLSFSNRSFSKWLIVSLVRRNFTNNEALLVGWKQFKINGITKTILGIKHRVQILFWPIRQLATKYPLYALFNFSLITTQQHNKIIDS